MRALQEGDRKFVVVRHVELKEPWTGAVCCSDVFDGCGAGGGEAVGEVEFLGYLCDGEFAQRVVDLVYADWSKADGGADFVSEDRGFRVPFVGVDEHAGDDAVPVEGLSVGEVGVGLPGVGGGVVPVSD